MSSHASATDFRKYVPAFKIRGWRVTASPPQTHMASETKSRKSLKSKLRDGFSRWELNVLNSHPAALALLPALAVWHLVLLR